MLICRYIFNGDMLKIFNDFHRKGWLLYLVVVGFCFFITTITSCKKDEPASSPVITLIQDSGFVYRDSILAVNQKITIGITAGGSDAVITYLGIRLETESKVTNLLDSGIHVRSLRYTRQISKGASNTERWIITVMDKNRHQTSVTLTFTRDPNSGFSPISHYPSIMLGAQDNSFYPHCFSVIGGATLANDSATLHQEMADIFYYYNQGGGPPAYLCTFSSPGENDAPTFYPFITNWTIRNSTYYNLETTVTLQDFRDCTNDSLLLAAYDESVGKRKFKNAVADNIIPFKTQSGKNGLMRVLTAIASPQGYIEVEMKVQK
ncbi:MAG: hypothetical protein NTU44_17910 [Bacteroidetes bacterium]|nr:hypothetical protein [Bacteroidota bacterium]